MRLPDEPDQPLQINIVPMVDVIFAILTFFIMSSLFLTRSTGLSVNLPDAQTAETQPLSQAIVTIAPDGTLTLNQQPVTLEQLPTTLQQRIGDQVVLVVLQADTQVDHGRVVAVMDRLRQMPNVRLAIATN